MILDNSTRYGLVSRLLHWLTAILFILQLLRLTNYVSEDNALWLALKPFHGSFGVLLMGILIVRIIWTLLQRHRRPPSDSIVAKLGHIGLYACMFLMSATGIARVYARGNPVKMFDIEIIAGTGEKIEWMATFAAQHAWLSWVTAILVIGHIGAALYHHFIKKDRILRRMA